MGSVVDAETHVLLQGQFVTKSQLTIERALKRSLGKWLYRRRFILDFIISHDWFGSSIMNHHRLDIDGRRGWRVSRDGRR